MRRPRWLQRPKPYVIVPQSAWDASPCPKCGLALAFLPGQVANRCGHCGTLVARGLG